MSKYSEKDVIDLRSGNEVSSTKAHDNFVDGFMKTANEAAETPKADTETKGSVETNIDNEVANTNHVQKNETEQLGIPSPIYLWGSPPPKDQPGTTNRRPDTETLSSSAEKINVEDNHDQLEKAFSNFASTSKTDKATVGQLFENGKPGKYVTRAQTLIEKVRGTIR